MSARPVPPPPSPAPAPTRPLPMMCVLCGSKEHMAAACFWMGWQERARRLAEPPR